MFTTTILGAVTLMATMARAQVTATGTMGSTNPPQATWPTAINQTSYSRLLSVNGINDFCLFAPPTPNGVIGETEEEEVAWCIQPRNNARVIPDGTFSSVHFVRTPLYLQIQGFGDLTKLNIQSGDEGGELDPHGSTGLGNPVGGNVTSNITGTDVHYEEWMNYMAYNEYCIRVCIAENSTYSAPVECQHTLDEMGCEWVMPGNYNDNEFDDCLGDSAYPPGIYPLANGSTSTFAQRYTGTYTNGDGSLGTFTVGQTVTPQTPYSIPATSQCTSYNTVGNGIPYASLGLTGSAAPLSISSNGTSTAAPSSSSAPSSSMSTSSTSTTPAAAVSKAASSASPSSQASTSAAATSATSKAGAMPAALGANYGSAVGALFSVVAVLAGAGVIML